MKLTPQEKEEIEQGWLAKLSAKERTEYDAHLARGGETYANMCENPEQVYRDIPPIKDVPEVLRMPDDTDVDMMIKHAARAYEIAKNMLEHEKQYGARLQEINDDIEDYYRNADVTDNDR